MMRKMLAIFVLLALFAWACTESGTDTEEADGPPPKSMVDKEEAVEYDSTGVGEVKEVELNNPLDPEMVERGEAIYNMKCSACHKLTDQRVVGPGWEDITDRRHPAWIMNMITNVEMMLAEDPIAQAQLEECLVRMPNQNLSVGDARDVLEFMYANDGQEVGTE